MADSDRIEMAFGQAFVDLISDDIEAWSKASTFIGEAAMHGYADKKFMPRLIELLESEEVNWQVCFALQGLAIRGIFDPSSLPRLFELLGPESTRARASGALAAMADRGVHDPDHLMKAVELLRDLDPDVRRNAAAWIGGLTRDGIVDPNCLPGLVLLLDHEDTKWNACLALCMLAERGVCDAGCLEKAIDLLNDSLSGVRNEASGLIGALAKNGISDRRCLPALNRLLDDATVKQNACCALGMLAEEELFDPSSLNPAIKLLDDPKPKVRNEAAALIAALAIRGVYGGGCVPGLQRLLNDERTRNNAGVALRVLVKRGLLSPEDLDPALAPDIYDSPGPSEMRDAIDQFYRATTADDCNEALMALTKAVYEHEGKIGGGELPMLHKSLDNLESMTGPGFPTQLHAIRAIAALANRGVASPASVAIMERIVKASSGDVKDAAVLALHRLYCLGLNNGHYLELYGEEDLQTLNEASQTTWLFG